VDVAVAGIVEPDRDQLQTKLGSITQDEPVKGTGEGTRPPT
jgi:hypothetical protein